MCVNKMEQDSSQWSPTKSTRDNRQNLKDLKLHLYIEKKIISPVKVVKNWQRLSREAVESPSLEILNPAWNTPQAIYFN